MSNQSKWGVFWLLVLGVVIGIVVSASTVSVVQWAGSNKFCTTWCHSMDGVSYAWKQGLHARTASGVTAGCSDCHLLNETNHPLGPIDYTALLYNKAKSGTISLIGEISGHFGTPQKWQENRAGSSKAVIEFMTSNNFRNCRGCHELDLMHNAKKPMVAKVHAGFIDKPTNCVMCHKTAGHDYKGVDEYIKTNGTFPPVDDAWKEPEKAAK